MIPELENIKNEVTLEEKYANMTEQLSGVTERLDRTQRDLDLERVSREDIIKAEIERRLAEERKKLEDEFTEKDRKLEQKHKEHEERLEIEKKEHEEMLQKKMERREADLKTAYANLTQKFIAESNRLIEEARQKAMENSIAKLAEELSIFMKAFLSIMDGNSQEGQELLKKYQEAIKATEETLEIETKEALEKAEKKANKQTEHIATLVRMLFTQKRERFEITDEERKTLLESVAETKDLSDEEKKEFREINHRLEEFRQRKRDAKFLRGEKPKGHGRNKIPETLPRLETIPVWPDCYAGHENEYRIVSMGDIKEVIVPNPSKYFVQPYSFPVIVKIGDPYEKEITHPRYQGITWKSHYSEELRSQIAVKKYFFHMPNNRQIKQFKMDGLDISASTMDDINESTCDVLEPLYKLQWQRVMKAKLLAADGSPMPVLDNEKHKTVKQYIIEYRSIDTGIPVFLSTPPMEGVKGFSNGRGKKVIQANLSDWTGQALMCDAYAGYDWVKKVGRILCRCSAHFRRKIEGAKNENPKLSKPLMALMQQIYLIEEIIRSDEKAKGVKMPAVEKETFRNNNAEPLWHALKLWCMKEILNVGKDTKIYDAMNYLLRHYDELTAYLDIADMPLDNNDTESSIRDMVMGKKAYMYCRNYESVDRACIMYSMLGACKVLGKNPEHWLTYVLKHIDTTPKDDLHKLLPEEWEEL